MEIKIGQKVYYTKYNSYLRTTELIEGIITKVGRLYFYVETLKVDKKTLQCENINMKVYLSKKEYNEKIEFDNKVEKIRSCFEWFNRHYEKLSIEKIRQIYEIIEGD